VSAGDRCPVGVVPIGPVVDDRVSACESPGLSLENRYMSLTLRERQVMDLVVTGKLNKQVAGELGISEVTVKAHRGKMMRKMMAVSLADLVNMAVRLRPPPVPDVSCGDVRDRYVSLSRREQEVMTLVVSGRLNKEIGGQLGISEITVQAHRGRVMRKMMAASLAGLVNMAAKLRLTTFPHG
jgi:FixJ family two-component response regulator